MTVMLYSKYNVVNSSIMRQRIQSKIIPKLHQPPIEITVPTIAPGRRKTTSQVLEMLDSRRKMAHFPHPSNNTGTIDASSSAAIVRLNGRTHLGLLNTRRIAAPDTSQMPLTGSARIRNTSTTIPAEWA